jgi:hypothetical protein
VADDRPAVTQWWRIVWRDWRKSGAPWGLGDPGRRFRDTLPPERPFLGSLFLVAVDAILVISAVCFAILLILAVLCFCGGYCRSIVDYACIIYLSPALLFVGTAIDRILRHRQKVHAARLEDRSEVERLFRDPALKEEQSAPVVSHLVRIGPEGWTEYQVLPLRQIITEKADGAELVTMAHTIITELREYAEGTAYRYDTDLYYDWKSRLDSATSDYTRSANEDATAESELRAVISGATEHVADYEMKWAEGSVMVRSLLTIAAVGSISALYYGILPLICSCGDFNIVNWIALGAVGELMSVLQNLRNSVVTEVGNTEGRAEIWRTVSGGTLGLIAGALAYGLIAADILTSSLVPHLANQSPSDMGKQ